MRTRIIRVGNSRGVRIPKPLLEQTGLTDEVTIEAEGNRLVIRPLSRPREGWDAAFRKMALAGDDRLLDGDLISISRWDEGEWQWRIRAGRDFRAMKEAAPGEAKSRPRLSVRLTRSGSRR